MAVILVSCLFSYGVMTSSLFSGRPLHLVTVKEDGFRCLFPVEHENAEINTTSTADIEVAFTAGIVAVADFHDADRFNDDNDDDTPRLCERGNLYLFRCHRLY